VIGQRLLDWLTVVFLAGILLAVVVLAVTGHLG
jgi:hypothetical protein